jgi:Core-2/I-Branching enzyme
LIHSNSIQLRRLINRLNSDNTIIFLHLDLKIEISLFNEYQNLPNVFFIKNRVKVNWGSYNMVQCVVNSFKEIIPKFKNDQYVSLISGQDYPLITNNEMNRFLSLNQGKAFMEFYPIYNDWVEAIPRLEKYHLTNYSFPGNTVVESILNSWLTKRKLPSELIYVGRSQWFTITIEHIAYIVHFLEKHPHIKRFFKLTWGSDEIVFQTILYSSIYKEQMVNNNLRYIDWSSGEASPKILTVDDIDKISNSGKFFARKFDANFDSEVLDWIDINLLT